MSSDMEKKRSPSRRAAAPAKSEETSRNSGGSTDDLTNKDLGKFAILKKIGSGGMGAVYLAKDTLLDRTVALKILPREKAENPTLVKRFRAEAKSSALLNHDNIVKVYESGEIDRLNYISMEFIDGIDVSDLIKRKGTVSVRRSIDIVRQIAMALAHAAERNIVHRDIKPSNFMITREGVVKLADMGLARAMDEATETSITRAGSTVGTVDYMAPEQARSSKAADIRSDIYSLGCAWFHMLSGKPPFHEGSVTNKLQAHAVSPIPDLRKLNENVPLGVVAIIARMMAKKPEDRYQTPEDLLADLENENILRSDIAEEGLDALAKEVADVNASRRSGKTPTLPPKEKRLVKANNDSSGLLQTILNFVPVLILVGISLGIMTLMWWGISGFGSALSSSGNPVNLSQAEEEEAQRRAALAEGQSLVETAGDRRVGQASTTTANSSAATSETPAMNLQEAVRLPPGFQIGNPNPGASLDAHPSQMLIRNDWYEATRFTTQKLASKKNFEPVDLEFARALSAFDGGEGVLELTDSGPYVLKGPMEVKASRLVLRGARNTRPVVLFLPDLKAGSEATKPITALTYKTGQHLIEGIEFVTILGDVGKRSPIHLVQIEGETKLDVIDGTFSQEGSNIQNADVNGIRLVGGEMSPTLRCFQSVFRGEAMTGVCLASGFGEVNLTRCVAVTGVQPVLSIIEPQEAINSTTSLSIQRSISLRESLLASRSAALLVDAKGRITPSPITQFSSTKTEFIQLPPASDAPSKSPGWLLGRNIPTDPSGTGAGNFEQSFPLELSQLRLVGYDHLLNLQHRTGPDRQAASLNDLEELWKSRWLEVTSAPPLSSPGVFRDFMSNTLTSLTNGLGRPSDQPDTLTAVKLDDYKSLTRVPIEREMMMSQALDRASLERLFVGAETIRIEIPKQRLQDVFHNDRLPPKAIIEVRGAGEIELPVTFLEDKIVRLDFGRPGDIIIKPLENKSSIAERSSDKLPFESLITIRNGLVDLRGATIALPPTKTLNSPIWAITSDRGHIALDRCQLLGPTVTDSLHAGLVRQLARPLVSSASSKSLVEGGLTILENSLLFSPQAVYWSDDQPSRVRMHNCAIISLSDAITLPASPSTESTTTSRPQPRPGRIELSSLTISSVGTAITIQGIAGTSKTPLVIQNSLFAPRMDVKTEGSEAPLLRLPSGQSAYIFWWFQNGISSARSQLTSEIAQSSPDMAEQWNALWLPGHDVGTLFGPDGVLLEKPLPAPVEFDLRALTLSSNCKAASWSTTGGPIGADIRQLVESFKSSATATRNFRETPPNQSGKINRPGF